MKGRRSPASVAVGAGGKRGGVGGEEDEDESKSDSGTGDSLGGAGGCRGKKHPRCMITDRLAIDSVMRLFIKCAAGKDTARVSLFLSLCAQRWRVPGPRAGFYTAQPILNLFGCT